MTGTSYLTISLLLNCIPGSKFPEKFSGGVALLNGLHPWTLLGAASPDPCCKARRGIPFKNPSYAPAATVWKSWTLCIWLSWVYAAPRSTRPYELETVIEGWISSYACSSEALGKYSMVKTTLTSQPSSALKLYKTLRLLFRYNHMAVGLYTESK